VNDLTKNILLWVVIVLVMLAVFSRYIPSGPTREQIRYSDFITDVHNGRVDSVILQGDTIRGVLKDKQQFETYNPETNYTALIGDLLKANVAIEGQPPKQPNFLAQLLLQLAPALLLMLVSTCCARCRERRVVAGRCPSARAARACSAKTRST